MVEPNRPQLTLSDDVRYDEYIGGLPLVARPTPGRATHSTRGIFPDLTVPGVAAQEKLAMTAKPQGRVLPTNPWWPDGSGEPSYFG